MKTLYFTAILLIFSVKLFSQNSSAAPDDFNKLCCKRSFVLAHEEPVAFKYLNPAGNMITYKTPDGREANAYEVKASGGSNKTLLVFHEWYGLNDYIKKESDELSSKFPGINVLALDLYDGKVATNNDEAVQYMTGLDKDRAVNIIKGVLDYTGANAELATIGWCFGGGWSLQTAIILNKNVKACVMYYGMPEKDKERLKLIEAPVLGIFGLKDEHISPALVEQFVADMKEVNKNIYVVSYDAVHGFANPSNPKYDAKAAKKAKKLTHKFLKDNFVSPK